MLLRNRYYVLRDEAGEGGEGGNGPDVKVLGETVKGLETQLGTVTQALGLMVKGQQETQEIVRGLAEAAKGNVKDDKGTPDPKPPSDSELFEGIDVEAMDKKEFALLVLQKFAERQQYHTEQALKPVVGRMAQLEQTITTDLGKRSVQQTLQDNKDLYEWKDEIGVLLKETPGLSLPRALAIVRAENPEKAKAMATKYAPASDERGGNVRYLGMTPTSRTGGEGDGKGGKMKFDEAASKAFDDVVASFGGSSFDQLMAGRPN